MRATPARLLIPAMAVICLAAGCARRPGAGGRDLSGKRVVIVVPHRGFRDQELREPRAILEARGARVRVACSSRRPAQGDGGALVTPDILLDQVHAAGCDALIFLGDAAEPPYWRDPRVQALIQEAAAQGKVLGAISLAPLALAQSGVLKLKRATVSPSAAQAVRRRGAYYTGADLQVDGRIITASGPGSARAFGEAVADVLARP